MNQRTRNMLILLAGFVLLGVVVGFIDRTELRQAPAAPLKVAIEPARPAKIFRMEGSLEELRKFPAGDGMLRSDESALKALPRGVEVSGEWVQPQDMLEGYAHPNGKRFFVIMQPGTRAYSIFLD